MTPYPWHKCDSRCYWWGKGDKEDWCNLDHIAVEADTGRPGCHFWRCAGCGAEWDEVGEDGNPINHENCMIVEVELEA